MQAVGNLAADGRLDEGLRIRRVLALGQAIGEGAGVGSGAEADAEAWDCE